MEAKRKEQCPCQAFISYSFVFILQFRHCLGYYGNPCIYSKILISSFRTTTALKEKYVTGFGGCFKTELSYIIILCLQNNDDNNNTKDSS